MSITLKNTISSLLRISRSYILGIPDGEVKKMKTALSRRFLTFEDTTHPFAASVGKADSFFHALLARIAI